MLYVAGSLGAAVVAALAVAGVVLAKRAPLAPSNPGAAATPAVTATNAVVTPAIARPPPPKVATVHIASVPDGATVSEGENPLCTTPCDLTFAGSDADAAHDIVVAKAGYVAESRSVKGGDGPVTVPLARLAAARPSPAPAAPPPPKPAAKPEATDKTPVPQGFKDIPY